MSALGNRLLSLIALSLQLPEDWFSPQYDTPAATLRLIRYPPQPGAAEFNQIGAGAHTDWGDVTILAQDMTGGLEVQTASGQWIEATPIRGAFVINIGDLMARRTNGIYNSNMHRVKNNRGNRDRYSIPFFYSPHPAALIQPMPGCADVSRPRLYPDCSAAGHMNEMFRRSYGYDPEAPQP
jgi:isopenicillin N synthase-like dioxygenase